MTYEICHWGLIVLFAVVATMPFIVMITDNRLREEQVMSKRGVVVFGSMAVGILGLFATHVVNLHATGQVHYELRQNTDGSTSWHWVDKQEVNRGNK